VSAGLKRETINEYNRIGRNYIKDGKVFLEYARLLYQTGELSKARMIIEQAKCYYISNEVFLLSAAIFQEMGMWKSAEHEYRKAIYMVPNRMSSRFELLNFYWQVEDTGNVKYWRNSILNMQVKVNSEKARLLKDRVARMVFSR
jgi:tetratricopeptide (TPR) repeat protein